MDEFLALAYARERHCRWSLRGYSTRWGRARRGVMGWCCRGSSLPRKADEPLRVHDDGQQTRCFCYVQDTVDGADAIAELPGGAGRVFNVGSTEEISILELARQVVEF